MIDLSNFTSIAQTDLWRNAMWLATNTNIQALVGGLGGVGGSLLVFVKIAYFSQKFLVDRKAKKISSQMHEQTPIASFSKNDIRDAITGYIWPDASSIDPSDESDLRNMPIQGPLLDSIIKIIDSNRERLHLILLADSGMGKTTFCINFYAKFRKSRKVAIVPLGQVDAIEMIKNIPFAQETVLFLDAFDEDAAAARDKDKRFSELMESAKNFQHVIVTCRSQFFLHDNEIPNGSRIIRVGPRKAGDEREYPMRRLYLAPFSATQIDQFVKSHFPWHNITAFRARARARKMIASIHDLSVRPMLLALVPDLVKDRATVRELFQLYEYMVGKWLKRESDWISQEALLSISKDLAVRLYVQQQNGGKDRVTPEELAAIADAHGKDIEHWKLTSRSLLNRDIDGCYKFSHRSILEYLFVTAAYDGREECFGVRWTDMMIQLLISRNASTTEYDQRITTIFDRDMGKTGIFPILKRESHPKLYLKPAIPLIVRTSGSDAEAKRINPAWIMSSYRVQEDTDVTTLTNLARGVAWRFYPQVPPEDDPMIYMDQLPSIAREISIELGLQVRPGAVEVEPIKWGRLPSILEMLWLSDYLQANFRTKGSHFAGAWLLEKNRYFWLGDAIKGTNYLVCTFSDGESPHNLTRIASVSDEKGTGGFGVYEVARQPGALWNSTFSAFTVRVPRGIEDWKRIGRQESDDALNPYLPL
ncbi:hypothetical protein BCO18430_06102 [Burkholderia contaminans]|uniref:NACHT domain-containing protein n=1 Tax=Burkholderia contaminans TaxID=488447 RepID=UPI00145405B9|nr:hypothetical protein [Burkholderia contaminans]VWD31960.1 hypothetical protein BCO18430_06102 [Burkholderia contaminans]